MTIDPHVYERAKDYALANDTNLSALVEKLLENATGPMIHEPDFVDKWEGKLQIRPPDPHDPLLMELRKKYGFDDDGGGK